MFTFLKNSKWNKKLNFTENNKFPDFKIIVFSKENLQKK